MDPQPSKARGVLDPLVARVLSTYPYRFTLAESPGERALAYRLRGTVVASLGWDPEASPSVRSADDAGGGALEHDEYDEVAVHVLGWVDDVLVSTGRLVLPPGPLPTEKFCGITVEPQGRVVDVGRMAVDRTYQSFGHAAFVALLCRLYLEMRERGYEVACGMMTPRARGLVRALGLSLEVLAPDRLYWGEQRAPVRFELVRSAGTVAERWDG